MMIFESALSKEVVAPHAGAWIEMRITRIAISSVGVAPHAGAWIEMVPGSNRKDCKQSHPTRVRGLKFPLPRVTSIEVVSHPTRVRGLKSWKKSQKH